MLGNPCTARFQGLLVDQGLLSLRGPQPSVPRFPQCALCTAHCALAIPPCRHCRLSTTLEVSKSVRSTLSDFQGCYTLLALVPYKTTSGSHYGVFCSRRCSSGHSCAVHPRRAHATAGRHRPCKAPPALSSPHPHPPSPPTYTPQRVTNPALPLIWTYFNMRFFRRTSLLF